MTLPNYIVLATGIWNIITFLLYGIDKYKAKANSRRISENTLILSAFFMGGLGALMGMAIFRHKTKHLRFKILVPLFLIMNIVISVRMLNYFEIIEISGLLP